MVSSKVSYPVQRFPVFLVRNPMMNLGNIPRNAALDAWFGGFPGNIEVSSMFPVRASETKGGLYELYGGQPMLSVSGRRQCALAILFGL